MKVVSLETYFLANFTDKKSLSVLACRPVSAAPNEIPLIDWVTGPETALIKAPTGLGDRAGLHWSHSNVEPSPEGGDYSGQ